MMMLNGISLSTRVCGDSLSALCTHKRKVVVFCVVCVKEKEKKMEEPFLLPMLLLVCLPSLSHLTTHAFTI